MCCCKKGKRATFEPVVCLSWGVSERIGIVKYKELWGQMKLTSVQTAMILIHSFAATGANFSGDLFDANFFATTLETDEEDEEDKFRFEDYTTDGK